MKLDPKNIRFITPDELRVLQAIELGSRNHEIVPVHLIDSFAKLKNSGLEQTLRSLARYNLIAKDYLAKYDGYRLAYGGYDYLALKTFSKRGTVNKVGHQIGVGKESDVYVVTDDEGEKRVLKIARLGRTSFRNIKKKRDYLKHKGNGAWWYLSRLAAEKEFAFMKVLHQHGFPVPEPVDCNRHCVVMEAIDAYPLNQVDNVGDPEQLYSNLMDLIVKLGRHGLIHCDFNEFNLLLREDLSVVLIDFPQMVSVKHENAETYFQRDVDCVRRFFRKRFRYESTAYPRFDTDVLSLPMLESLDKLVFASGWTRKQETALNNYHIQTAEQEPFISEVESDQQSSDNDSDSEESLPELDLNGLSLAS